MNKSPMKSMKLLRHFAAAAFVAFTASAAVAPMLAAAQSSDATLRKMQVIGQGNPSLLMPSFDANTFDYLVAIDRDDGGTAVSSFNARVTALPNDSAADVTVSGPPECTLVDLTSTVDIDCDVAHGTGVVTTTFVVTAADGETTKTYTLGIGSPLARAPLMPFTFGIRETVDLSRVLQFTPEINERHFLYTLVGELPASSDTVNASINWAGDSAGDSTDGADNRHWFINGVKVSGEIQKNIDQTISLQPGRNVLEARFRESTDKDYLPYRFIITRALPPQAVAAHRLNGLVISEGTLSPIFDDGADLDYTAEVANATENVTITPSVAAGSVVTLKKDGVAQGTAMAASLTESVALEVGENTFTIETHAAGAADGDAAVNVYTLTLTRMDFAIGAALAPELTAKTGSSDTLRLLWTTPTGKIAGTDYAIAAQVKTAGEEWPDVSAVNAIVDVAAAAQTPAAATATAITDVADKTGVEISGLAVNTVYEARLVVLGEISGTLDADTVFTTAAAVARTFNNVVTLKSLRFIVDQDINPSVLQPAFDPEIEDYLVGMDRGKNTDDAVALTPIASTTDPNARAVSRVVKVQRNKTGVTYATVEVIAENGADSKTYRIGGAIPINGFTALTIEDSDGNDIPLTPLFSFDRHTDKTFFFEAEDIDVSITEVTLNMTYITGGGKYPRIDLNGDNTFVTIPARAKNGSEGFERSVTISGLIPGENVIRLRFNQLSSSADDDDNALFYTITINSVTAATDSSLSTLSVLSAPAILDGLEIPTDPQFDGGTTTYALGDIASHVGAVYITAAATDDKARLVSVTLNGTEINATPALTFGGEFGVDISGITADSTTTGEIVITVDAQDPTKTTDYTLSFTRQTPPTTAVIGFERDASAAEEEAIAHRAGGNTFVGGLQVVWMTRTGGDTTAGLAVNLTDAVTGGSGVDFGASIVNANIAALAASGLGQQGTPDSLVWLAPQPAEKVITFQPDHSRLALLIPVINDTLPGGEGSRTFTITDGDAYDLGAQAVHVFTLTDADANAVTGAALTKLSVYDGPHYGDDRAAANTESELTLSPVFATATTEYTTAEQLVFGGREVAVVAETTGGGEYEIGLNSGGRVRNIASGDSAILSYAEDVSPAALHISVGLDVNSDGAIINRGETYSVTFAAATEALEDTRTALNFADAAVTAAQSLAEGPHAISVEIAEAAPAGGVQVFYETEPVLVFGGNPAAVAGTDFEITPADSVTIAENETSAEISVHVIEDADDVNQKKSFALRLIPPRTHRVEQNNPLTVNLESADSLAYIAGTHPRSVLSPGFLGFIFAIPADETDVTYDARLRVANPLGQWTEFENIPRDESVPGQQTFSCNTVAPNPLLSDEVMCREALIENLHHNTAYDFQARAVNESGAGPWSTWSTFNAATTAGEAAPAPQAPTLTAATAAGGTIALQWDAPAAAGTFTLTDYRLRWRSAAGPGEWQGWISDAAGEFTIGDAAAGISAGDVTAFTLTSAAHDLQDGTEYEAQVAAVTAASLGAWSNSMTATTGAPKSADSALTALTVDGQTLEPVFVINATDADTDATYTLDKVENTTTSLSITPTLRDANAAIAVTTASTGVTVPAAADGVAFNVGIADAEVDAPLFVVITVTAEDGVTDTAYTIAFRRAKSSVKLLSAIEVADDSMTYPLTKTGAETTAGFAATHLTYETLVEFAIKSVTFTATIDPASIEATVSISIRGNVVGDGDGVGVISLDVGDNIVTVTVTAQDETAQNYEVNVIGKPDPTKSDINTLSALTVSTVSPETVTLAPVFAADTFDYTINVLFDTATLTFTPTVTDTGKATVSVNDADVTDGEASESIELIAGRITTIAIVVTAENNFDKQTYSVKVRRDRNPDLPSAADVNDDKAADSTDGLLIARYLLGLRGANLTDAAADADIEARLKAEVAAGTFNIDAAGDTTAADGIMIARYYFGVTEGAGLTAGQSDTGHAEVAAAIALLENTAPTLAPQPAP